MVCVFQELFCTQLCILSHLVEIVSDLHNADVCLPWCKECPKNQLDPFKKIIPVHQTFENSVHVNTNSVSFVNKNFWSIIELILYKKLCAIAAFID